MGFFSSVWEGVKSVASKAVSVVSSAVKKVGEVVVDGAKKFLEIEVGRLKTVQNILETIGKALGIIKPEEDLEEIGDKAMKAEKKPEDFDSINSYIDYLRNEIHSSKEELEKLSPEERLARVSIGAALTSKAIEEKKSLEIPVEFWKEAVNLGLSAKEIDEFLTKFKQAGVKPEEFLKYLKRELNVNEEEKVESALVDAYKELEPQKDIKDIEEQILRMQR